MQGATQAKCLPIRISGRQINYIMLMGSHGNDQLLHQSWFSGIRLSPRPYESIRLRETEYPVQQTEYENPCNNDSHSHLQLQTTKMYG